MYSHGVSRHVWLLTVSLGLTLAFSVLGSLSEWTTGFMIGGIASSGFSLVLWLTRVARQNRGMSEQSESVEHIRTSGTEAVPFGAADGNLTVANAADRQGQDDLVRTCYEITARISFTRDLSREMGSTISKAIESVRKSCLGLHDVVTGLRDRGENPGWPDSLAEVEGGGQRSFAWSAADHSHSLNTMLEEVISAVREMAGILREVDHNARELITSTEETAYSMSRLDSFLQDMANSGRELEASTDTANRVALEGTKVVGEMGKENEAIITTVKEAASSVEDLGRWSQEVGKIVEVIRDIADETNLLALNAAIIAAQSGEHGKAFGVVAEEIRGLAERTSSSTQEISDLVNTVQKNVANVVQGMKKSLQRVERGELLTRNAGMVLEKVFESFESSRNLAKQIASSTFEHKIDSSHIVRSLHKVTDIARRLEAHKSGRWTDAGETIATARMLRVLSDESKTAVATLDSRCHGINDTSNDEAPAVAGDQLERGVAGTADAWESDLADSLKSLASAKDELSRFLAALDDAAESARDAAKRLPHDLHGRPIKKCWEVAGCSAEIRQRCPAHEQSDWRCFLTEGVVCMQAGTDDAHGHKKCPECPAFEANVGSQVTHTIDSGKR